MSTPGSGSVHHVPSDGTKPYDGAVSNGLLRITFVVEGGPVIRDYEWLPAPQQWAGVTYIGWRRQYFPDDPPGTPPGGTYKVWEGPDIRETGRYATA